MSGSWHRKQDPFLRKTEDIKNATLAPWSRWPGRVLARGIKTGAVEETLDPYCGQSNQRWSHGFKPEKVMYGQGPLSVPAGSQHLRCTWKSGFWQVEAQRVKEGQEGPFQEREGEQRKVTGRQGWRGKSLAETGAGPQPESGGRESRKEG